MSSPSEKKLTDAIHEAEQLEHDLEKRVKELKRQDEELHSPDAISKALKGSGPNADHLRAPHLAD